MKNVTYISAGAGSGKTYTLTKILSELMEGSLEGYRKASPDKVILTTFTVKAAAEFKERAKAFLFEKGLNDEAARMDQAMMGTIHGVANSFINKYWFHLGLSPKMSILLEEDVDFYITQSLAELPDENELAQLRGFCDEFGLLTGYVPGQASLPDYDYWKRELSEIINLSTNYGITDYRESCEQSIAFFRQFVRPDAHVNLDESFLKALLDEEQRNIDGQKDSATKEGRIRSMRSLRRNVGRANLQWLKTFAGLPTATEYKKSDILSTFKDMYDKLHGSEYVFSLFESHIRLVFDLAQRWRENYAAYKVRKRLLDFNDLEKYMYELLQMPEVAGEIAESFDYLFVDEFQDCSPIQVKIFDRLSDLVSHSWWVGDFKQAIYGFRGSDTALTKAIVDRIETGENGCGTQTLEKSYRSLPDIVEFTNHAFTKTFEGVLPEDKVKLTAVKENTDDTDSLRYFVTDGKSPNDMAEEILPYIFNLLDRGVAPKDIAILARTNSTLAKIDECLQNESIPTNRASDPVVDDDVTTLMEAILSLVMNADDNLARATIAFLTQDGYGTGALIDAKLEYNAMEEQNPRGFLCDVPMISKILQLRPTLRQQSVAALVESLVIELGLHDFFRGWGNVQHSTAVLHVIEETARQYEQHSIQMNLPATISGFVDYLNLLNPACPGDENGIQLLTCHGAKGLEWKYVFLTSLDDDPSDTRKLIKREIFGVHAFHKETPSRENPFPDVNIMVCPWTYGSGRAHAPESMEQMIISSEMFTARKEAAISEANRLLYVAITRASEVLTLCILNSDKQFCWPIAVGLTKAGAADRKRYWDVFGTGDFFREFDLNQNFEPVPVPDEAFIDERMAVPFAGEACTAPSRYQQPSAQKSEGATASLLADTSERIPLGKMSGHDMAEVGTCIHNIFCIIESMDNRIGDIIEASGLQEVLTDSTSIVKAWKNLTEYLTAHFGKAEKIHHELPFSYAQNGQIFNGSMDLVWRTPSGCVLVDFKTCPKGKDSILDPEDQHFAGHYAGQFACYEKALKGNGDNVLAKIVYYPVSGLIVELKSAL